MQQVINLESGEGFGRSLVGSGYARLMGRSTTYVPGKKDQGFVKVDYQNEYDDRRSKQLHGVS